MQKAWYYQTGLNKRRPKMIKKIRTFLWEFIIRIIAITILVVFSPFFLWFTLLQGFTWMFLVLAVPVGVYAILEDARAFFLLLPLAIFVSLVKYGEERRRQRECPVLP
jgi:hypothetical protein